MGKKDNYLNFNINHLDPMGQGVHKENSQIYFIKKTLPEEKGVAEVFKSKKGVHFAHLKEIQEPSALRIEPACPHFKFCNGCSYLHTDYKNELSFKLNSLKKYLQKSLPEQFEIELIPSPQRLGYRNRVQLHFKGRKIGYQDSQSQIIEVPGCLLPSEKIKKEIEDLYSTQKWQNDSKNMKEGYFVIYEKSGQVRTELNSFYSPEGFRQVNQEVNLLLKDKLIDIVKECQISDLSFLELFSGEGNLTKNLKFQNKLLVDSFAPKNPPEFFLQQDLYKEGAIERVKEKIGSVDLLILDPPRSGLSHLKDWVQTFNPQFVLYISCNPATLARDIEAINMKIKSAHLLDMFPGTHHYETLLLLEA